MKLDRRRGVRERRHAGLRRRSSSTGRDTHRVVLTGNVTFRDKDAQISADRAEFNTETRLGTFFNASGFAQHRDGGQARRAGRAGARRLLLRRHDREDRPRQVPDHATAASPPACSRRPAGRSRRASVTLRLDHYAFLTNAVIKAKGVPVFYLPALYYPIQKDDRATGILMPTYGTSTYKGFTLSNAFFWAINRSQDATFMHDWFKKRGQGFGGEYRYAAGAGLERLRRSSTTCASTSRPTRTTPAARRCCRRARATRSRSSVSHALGRRWTARGRVDYFTDITVNQAYNTDIYDTSRSSRMYGGGISGSLPGFIDQRHLRPHRVLRRPRRLARSPVRPRASRCRATRSRCSGAPAYFSVNTEYASLVRQNALGRRRHRRPRPAALRRDADGPRAVHEAAASSRSTRRSRGAAPGGPAACRRRATACVDQGDQPVATSTCSRA